MFSEPLTRADLGARFDLEGKELTARIREEKQRGKLIARRVWRDPVMGGGKRVIYQFIATNLSLGI